MKTWLVLLMLGVLFAGIALSGSPASAQYYSSTRNYTDRDARNLVAPIALYPDPLLAIILPASTYVDQVVEADRMNIRNNERELDRQNWDISVRALAHYPSVLQMMARDPYWTGALGQAYYERPQEVMDAIQWLRREARYNGVLQSNREQRVYLEGNYVRIVPAQPTYIYAPQYNPDVVYIRQRSNNNQTLLAFGLGLLIGSWLSNDTDWSHHRVYNHGWRGSGWVADSRPHVTINNIYIVNRDQSVLGNRTIISRQVDVKRIKHYSLPVTTTKNWNTPITSTPTKTKFSATGKHRAKTLQSTPTTGKTFTKAGSSPKLSTKKLKSSNKVQTNATTQKTFTKSTANGKLSTKSYQPKTKVTKKHVTGMSGNQAMPGDKMKGNKMSGMGGNKMSGNKMTGKGNKSTGKDTTQNTKNSNKDKKHNKDNQNPGNQTGQ